MSTLVDKHVCCPYCGEDFEARVDTSVGSQIYVEDCYVCCRPISFRTMIDHDGNLMSVELRRDDD